MSKLEETIHAAFFGRYGVRGSSEISSAIVRNIEEHFLLIDRDDFPAAKIIRRLNDKDNAAVVEDSGQGTWPISTRSAANARRWGLEYLSAAEAIETYQAEQQALEAGKRVADAENRDKRRDELAAKFYIGGARYDRLTIVSQHAIDYIIELEDAAHD